MKRFVSLAVGIMVLAVVVITAHADNKADAASISLNTGGYFFEGNQDYKDNYTFGLRVGYNITENWGTEAFFNYVKSEYKPSGGDNEFYVAGIEAIYHFMPKSLFVPFLAAGIGATHYSAGDSALVPSKFAFDYGAGLKLFVTDNIALRADVRHVLPIGSSDKYGNNPNSIHNDVLATLGIHFSFGGNVSPAQKYLDELEKQHADETAVFESLPAPENVKPSVPVNVIADADRDGVPDNIDECPDSPASVVVDTKGCPLDSDKDGVPDYLDKCPNTPAGAKVDNDGCPLDSDKDGVPNYVDKCPDTPEGVKVGKDGCPLDSDKDGVPNYVDKCPNTPAGALVEKDGCAYEKISIRMKVEFDSGKSIVKKKYHKEIKSVADFMQANPEAKATIVGHTDDVGNAKKNLLLSQSRANSIRQLLIAKFHIDGSRIKALGYGADRPLAINKTKEGRQKNRRVVAVFETVVLK